MFDSDPLCTSATMSDPTFTSDGAVFPTVALIPGVGSALIKINKPIGSEDLVILSKDDLRNLYLDLGMLLESL